MLAEEEIRFERLHERVRAAARQRDVVELEELVAVAQTATGYLATTHSAAEIRALFEFDDDLNVERVPPAVPFRYAAREALKAGFDIALAHRLSMTTARATSIAADSLLAYYGLPRLRHAVLTGEASGAKLRIVMKKARDLSLTDVRKIDEFASAQPHDLTPHRLGVLIDRQAALLAGRENLETARKRHRTVQIERWRDGTARLTLTGPTTALGALYQRTRAMARAITLNHADAFGLDRSRQAIADPRKLNELMFDIITRATGQVDVTIAEVDGPGAAGTAGGSASTTSAGADHRAGSAHDADHACGVRPAPDTEDACGTRSAHGVDFEWHGSPGPEVGDEPGTNADPGLIVPIDADPRDPHAPRTPPRTPPGPPPGMLPPTHRHTGPRIRRLRKLRGLSEIPDLGESENACIHTVTLTCPTHDDWLRRQAAVTVAVPAMSLLDARSGGVDLPGELHGTNPIPAETAREILSYAPHLERILTDPVDGTVLPIAAQKYRIPAALRRTAESRWHTCAAPGCDVPAQYCEIDHLNPFDHSNPEAGGRTVAENLHPLCKHHHDSKTRGVISAEARVGTELHVESEPCASGGTRMVGTVWRANFADAITTRPLHNPIHAEHAALLATLHSSDRTDSSEAAITDRAGT